MLNLVEIRGPSKLKEKYLKLDFQNALTRLDYADLDQCFVKPGHESIEAAHKKFPKLEVGQQRRIDLPADPTLLDMVIQS